MANHAYARVSKPLDPDEVGMHIRSIVAEKLKGLFQVEYNAIEKLWFISYKKDDSIGFQMWISNDMNYENDEEKLVCKDGQLEFRHGHTWQFMWWVEGVVRENLGAIYNAKMFDDGCEIEPTPNPIKYETFESFCRLKPDGALREKKEIKYAKKNWLPDYQLKVIPAEIKETFNLDFKV